MAEESQSARDAANGLPFTSAGYVLKYREPWTGTGQSLREVMGFH